MKKIAVRIEGRNGLIAFNQAARTLSQRQDRPQGSAAATRIAVADATVTLEQAQISGRPEGSAHAAQSFEARGCRPAAKRCCAARDLCCDFGILEGRRDGGAAGCEAEQGCAGGICEQQLVYRKWSNSQTGTLLVARTAKLGSRRISSRADRRCIK